MTVRFTWKRGALYELRSEPGVVDYLEAMGASVVDDANDTLPEGEGYRMSSRQGRKRPQGRWAVRVYTASTHAKRSNAVHNTLTRLVN